MTTQPKVEAPDASPSPPAVVADQVGRIVRAPKTAEIIATSLRRGIVTGRLKEGETLPSEAELMTQFGVSRPTLREAFRILETESLISIRRGSRGGARVMGPQLVVASRYVGMLLQMSGTTIGEVYDARGTVESDAVRLLAGRRTDEDLRDLAELVARLREPVGAGGRSLDDWAACSAVFHGALVSRCGNRALAIQWGVLGDVLERHLASSVAQRWDHPRTAAAVRKSVRSYERLVALVEGRRADDAAAHWREHTRVAGEVLTAGAGSTAIVDLFT